MKHPHIINLAKSASIGHPYQVKWRWWWSDAILAKFYAAVYQQALADLANEFDRHDFFRERDMVKGFARTASPSQGGEGITP